MSTKKEFKRFPIGVHDRDPELEKMVFDLRSQGLSLRTIAGAVDFSHTTIANILRKDAHRDQK